MFRRNNITPIGRSFDVQQQSKSREIRQGWKWFRRIGASIAALIFALIPTIVFANMATIVTNDSATIIAQIRGANVTLSNLVINQGLVSGVGKSIATFTAGAATPNIGITAGLALVTGDAATAVGPNNVETRTSGINAVSKVSDADLASIDSKTQYDTTTVSVDVVPTGNYLSVGFVFASEEYDEYVCSSFNDSMGIFVNGTNIARVAGGSAITINKINNGSVGLNGSAATSGCVFTNNAFYRSNAGGANTQYDAFTVPLEAFIAVTPGSTYKVKIAVADIGDYAYDSAVFVNKISSYNFDLSDAPSTYSSPLGVPFLAPASGIGISAGPARHSIINSNVYLGTIPPDADNLFTNTPATVGSIANYDDITGTPDDEDAFSVDDWMVAAGITNYTSSPTIPVRNNSSTTATLMGWIDFNNNGVFGDVGELATVNVPVGATTASLTWAGTTPAVPLTTYARFRITTDATLIASPNSIGFASDGEVEDYRVKLFNRAKVLLVKRITGIKPAGSTTVIRTTNPNDGTSLNPTTVVHNPADTLNNDTNANWPSSYVVGAFNAGKIKPGDEIEYTIYYLNAQGSNSNNLKICDPIRGKQAYAPGTMQLQPGSSTTPIGLTDLVDTTIDRANSYLPGAVNVPANCNAGSTTATGVDRGGVAIGITGLGANPQPDLSALPSATSSGTPTTSYGWFRFRAKVDP